MTPPSPGTSRAETIEALALRPLSPLRSFKVKLGVLVAVTVTLAAALAWVGVSIGLPAVLTIPVIVGIALVVTQLLARGMTSPLRQMTRAAAAMARGDYSQRIVTSSRDEVGQLAEVFTVMAGELEETDRMRRDLVANVSHELRTPVAALRSQLENLVDGVVAPDTASLEVALGATERLSSLVDHLLDLSRIDAGVASLEHERIALTPFLRDAVDTAALAARARGRSVRWHVDVDPADLSIDADGERLGQAITNLLDNASRHSPEQGRILVTARPVGTSVAIEVSDEGPGIAEADRERVFERFQRGGSDDSTGGTGLGLAIARWAVDQHSGTIAVQPSAAGGRSSRIRITLPASPAHD